MLFTEMYTKVAAFQKQTKKISIKSLVFGLSNGTDNR